MNTPRTALLSSTRARRPRLGAALAVALAAAGLHIAAAGAPVAAAPGCTDIDVVVARGTDEPGFFGAEIGDPLVGTLREVLPAPLSGYRVEYPASLLDTGSVGAGSRDLVGHIARLAESCPGTRFVLAGYSQGAVVVHTALGTAVTAAIPGAVRLPAELAGRIAVVLLFGDPLRVIGQDFLPMPYAARLGILVSDRRSGVPAGREPAGRSRRLRHPCHRGGAVRRRPSLAHALHRAAVGPWFAVVRGLPAEFGAIRAEKSRSRLLSRPAFGAGSDPSCDAQFTRPFARSDPLASRRAGQHRLRCVGWVTLRRR